MLAERAHADGARSSGRGASRRAWGGRVRRTAVATTQASLTSAFYFPKSGWEVEVEEERKQKSETSHPEVYGARSAVGDSRLGGGGGVDGDQYAGSVLAMDVFGIVGDGGCYCGGD